MIQRITLKQSPRNDRAILLRCSSELLADVRNQAAKNGLTVSAYIRGAVAQRMKAHKTAQ